MNIIREVISWLVGGIGLIAWIFFLPQIKLLLKQKEARSISLGLVWGSFGMQFIMFLHVMFQRDWKLLFALFTSLTCLIIILSLIYYYRKFPGGHKKF